MGYASMVISSECIWGGGGEAQRLGMSLKHKATKIKCDAKAALVPGQSNIPCWCYPPCRDDRLSWTGMCELPGLGTYR